MAADQAEEFDREIEHVPAAELPAAHVRWALVVTGADDEDERLFGRLAYGENIGATPANTHARNAMPQVSTPECGA
ncbi:hypothetical protein AB8O64_13690 [Streptomyces sp. QH1-20]|uniref:hypothetical protein n=1 Tax=Streptomyces sp. QH1-20 TaxID=3240934 RepID=UPI00351626AE